MRRAFRDTATDGGATTVEYALMASLIAMVVLAAVLLFGANVLGLFNESASSYSEAV